MNVVILVHYTILLFCIKDAIDNEYSIFKKYIKVVNILNDLAEKNLEKISILQSKLVDGETLRDQQKITIHCVVSITGPG